MATKSRNKLIKLFVFAILLTVGISGIFTTITTGGNYFKNYYETDEFHQEYNQFVSLLSLFELTNLTKEEAKKAIEVSTEEIEEHRFRYGELDTQVSNIVDQYRYQIEEAVAAGNEEVADVYREERDEKIADIKENFKSDEHVREKIVKEKEKQIDEYYERIEQYRSQYLQYKESFSYHLKDTKTGEVYTNLALSQKEPVEELLNKKNTNFIQYYPSKNTGHFTAEVGNSYVGEYNETISELTKNQTFEGVVGVPKAKSANSVLIGWSDDYEQRQTRVLVFASTSLVALIASWFLRGWRSLPLEMERKLVEVYRRIPIDVRFLLAGLTSFFLLLCFFLIADTIHYFEAGETIFALIVASCLLMALLFQGKWLWKQTPESLEDSQGISTRKQEWKRSLLARMFRVLKDAFLNRKLGTQVILLLMNVFLLGASIILVLLHPAFLILLGILLVFGLFSFITMLKFTGYLNKIVENTNELAAGKMGPDLPVKGKSVLAKLAGNINVLKHGVKKSKTEQAKSERLKTELITNVSHDLRTPLTSIITYSELLKTPDLSEVDRAAYIEIIDRKSKRLKVLIDDLFEASKMASGSVELVKEKVDLVQLLQQALAEHNGALEYAGLQLRIATPEKSVYAMVDGQKLWRVFDNLIGNILKYSLENTRVYITLKQNDGEASITFKNVTKYELSENVDELYERFKRGDESRNTEGSGLGLAIAKSIVDLHEGQMDIDVDGDLFKITITLEGI